MEVIFLDKIDSTQKYLKNLLKNSYKEYFVWSLNQTNGIGSRENSWIGVEGNLFFSFSIKKKSLPKDLKLESSSIYFSYLLKDILSKLGSKVYLKWPNDFYIEDKKIGGTITNLIDNYLICGIGLNLKKINDNFGYLDIDIEAIKIVNYYLDILKLDISWENVFEEFKKDFEKSKKFFVNINNSKNSLKSATLNSDGSIKLNNKRYFSLR